jgi:inosine-uridine nucleoside N-ribohydrolase
VSLPFLLGTDIDDTWALALLLRCPELDLQAVVSASGPLLGRPLGGKASG